MKKVLILFCGLALLARADIPPPPEATAAQVTARTGTGYVSARRLPVGGTGTVTSTSVVTANGVSGTVATATTTPAITLTLGAITPTTVNGNTFTTGSYTLTGTAAKTLTFTNSLTLSGTDGVVMTTPTTSFTAARTDAANTFTGTQTFAKVIATEFFTTPVTGTTGTTNALTAGEIIYFATFVNGTTTTLTLPVTPALGDNFFVWINGANGTATLTTSATVYRAGDSSSGTVFTPNQVSGANAKHQMKFVFDGTNWWENDTFSSVSEKIAVFSVDGGGSAITTGTVAGTSTALTGYTLTGWSISATAATGTVTVKIWNRATGTAIPTIANVINTNGISLSTGTTVYSTTISDFTDTSYAAQDLFRCAITAVDGTATDLTVTLFGTRL